MNQRTDAFWPFVAKTAINAVRDYFVPLTSTYGFFRRLAVWAKYTPATFLSRKELSWDAFPQIEETYKSYIELRNYSHRLEEQIRRLDQEVEALKRQLAEVTAETKRIQQNLPTPAYKRAGLDVETQLLSEAFASLTEDATQAAAPSASIRRAVTMWQKSQRPSQSHELQRAVRILLATEKASERHHPSSFLTRQFSPPKTYWSWSTELQRSAKKMPWLLRNYAVHTESRMSLLIFIQLLLALSKSRSESEYSEDPLLFEFEKDE